MKANFLSLSGSGCELQEGENVQRFSFKQPLVVAEAGTKGEPLGSLS